jgi:hypothetical protein
MGIEQQDKLTIMEMREQGRSERNLVRGIDLYNKYNPNNKVRKRWCGACSNRVFDWVNTTDPLKK